MSIQYLFVAAIKAALWELKIDSAKLQVQTQSMDQSHRTDKKLRNSLTLAIATLWW